MKEILLANLGNSHIRYIGTTPEIQLKGDRNVPFRESTRYLMEHIDEERHNVIAEILPPLLEMKRDVLTKMVLFTTDSPPGERNNQDTIYEGAILKKIFEKNYVGIEVVLIPISIVVTDINALMQFYRDTVNNLLLQHPDVKFVLADAGGTSQQKSALKIILEYLLDTDQFEAYNIKFKGGKSIPEQIASDEYRRVINQQQIGQLIQQYDYTGALVVSGINWKKTTTSVSALLRIGQALFSNDVSEGRKRAQQFPKNLGLRDTLRNIEDGSIYKEAIEKYNK